jgi:hypothetical protein
MIAQNIKPALLSVSDLSDGLLDYYVGVTLKANVIYDPQVKMAFIRQPQNLEQRGWWITYQPSSRGDHAAPIQANEKISLVFQGTVNDLDFWAAYYDFLPEEANPTTQYGYSPFEALCRALIAKRLGTQIDTEKYPIKE